MSEYLEPGFIACVTVWTQARCQAASGLADEDPPFSTLHVF